MSSSYTLNNTFILYTLKQNKRRILNAKFDEIEL